MKGTIGYRKDRQVFFVRWWDEKKKRQYKIYRYRGLLMYSEKIAQKLLAEMQGDVEKGFFRIEKYTKENWSDTVTYLWKWLEIIKPNLSPATYKDYSNSIKNYLEPFFKRNKCYLHEISYDVLLKLLNSIDREGKGKKNVMYCLHRCLDFAFRSERIKRIPPFPEKRDYKIVEKPIVWIPEERQMNIINAIPEMHRPIFLFLKYHARRPSEAMALHLEDYDPLNQAFTIRRSISARKVVQRTKTGQIHLIPCHSEFLPVIESMPRVYGSPFFFTCQTSRTKGKRYTHSILSRLWKAACKDAGEDISLYNGTKHSTCSQFINEKGFSESEVQMVTDHARLESVKRYAKTELAAKRTLMERKVINLGDIRKEKAG